MDCKNAIAPQTGFQKQIIDDLNKLTRDYFDIQRYVCLLIDEMKIKSNLVFDKKNDGELILVSLFVIYILETQKKFLLLLKRKTTPWLLMLWYFIFEELQLT